MTKSQLIESVSARFDYLSAADTAAFVRVLLDAMAQTLAAGGRIEIRGFGSFRLNLIRPRLGRNPLTGATVRVSGKRVPYFKAGKELKERVTRGFPARRFERTLGFPQILGQSS